MKWWEAPLFTLIYCPFVNSLIILTYLYLQTERIRKAASLKIQRHYRGHAIRQKHKERLRTEFDAIQNSYRKNQTGNHEDSIKIKKTLMSQLLTFFEVKKDASRIVSKYTKFRCFSACLL